MLAILIMILLNRIFLQMYIVKLTFHADISYIYTAVKKKMLRNTKDAHIFVGNITWHLLYSKTVNLMLKANIGCWILLPDIQGSINQ